MRGTLEATLVPLLQRNEAAFLLADGAVSAPAGPGADSAADAPAGAGPGGLELPARFLSPRHAHGAHEVCWGLRGRCVLAFDALELPLGTGQVCVVRPGEVHQLRPLPALESFDTLWWHVTAGGINLGLAGFGGERYVAWGGFVPLAPSPTPALARIVRELEGSRPRRDLLVGTIFLELTARILRHLDEAAADATAAATPVKLTGEGSWHVQRIVHYLEAHYNAPITLERLAEVAGLSPYHLTRLFGRHTGRGVMAYLSDVRHRESLSLLRNTDLTVAEVALSVGYDDPYYFSRVFRGREGCAPLYYRQHAQGGGALAPAPAPAGVVPQGVPDGGPEGGPDGAPYAARKTRTASSA